jgi:hypothetical protein
VNACSPIWRTTGLGFTPLLVFEYEYRDEVFGAREHEDVRLIRIGVLAQSGVPGDVIVGLSADPAGPVRPRRDGVGARGAHDLLDDLIRPREERRRDGQAERLGGLEVDH